MVIRLRLRELDAAFRGKLFLCAAAETESNMFFRNAANNFKREELAMTILTVLSPSGIWPRRFADSR
jgi:hypothetical protein